MIYTVTLNPAIDLVIVTKKLEPKVVNRTEKFELQPNGKGVNVSFILKKLGVASVATGIGGGFTLDYVISGLRKKNIESKFFKVQEATRVNVFTDVLEEKTEYKLVNPGPIISLEVQKKFLTYLEDTLKEKDTVVVSGSFSRGIKSDFLMELARVAQKKQAKFVIDSSYLTVMDTLKYHPFLLKPNEAELAHFFNFKEEMTQKNTIMLAQALIERGCQNVLVSLGARGAAFINHEHILLANAPQIKVVNSAGAGDTMLGTFIALLDKKESLTKAFKLAVAAGSDTASKTGLTDFALEKLLPQISVKEGMK